MSEIEFRLFQKINATFDTPAFCRRAAAVDEAWNTLRARCQSKRDELLAMARMRLASFMALLNDQRSLALGVLSNQELVYLDQLNGQWGYRLRVAVAPATSTSQLHGPLVEIQHSFTRFNQRWSESLCKIDLSCVNQLRENYNRYYVIEKECALWSAKLAQRGFVPLKPLRHEDLLEQYPLLEIPGSNNE